MKKLLSLVLAVLTAFSLLPAAFAASPFTDADGIAIQYVYENGLMNGMGDNKFAPETGVSRAMVWTVLARLSDVELAASEPWWESARQWAMSVGITDGTMAEEIVTLEQLYTMFFRYAALRGVVFVPGELDVLAAFSDKGEISDWAYTAMQWAVTEGLVDADATALSPKADASRLQLAEKLYALKDVSFPDAIPEAKTYTVTLLDGTNIVSIYTVKEGETAGTLPVLSKPGFFFSGWFMLNGGRLTADTVITSDVTATARYVAGAVGGAHYCTIEWTVSENGWHEGHCTDSQCGMTFSGPCADGNDADTLCESCKDDLSAYEAERSGVLYTSLSDAIALGGTVKLYRNVALTETLTVAADVTVTLDLAGYTLSYTSSVAGTDALIKNNGDLTIQDSSAAKTGRLSFTATAPDTAAVPGYASNTITNAGRLTVNGGTIENLTTGSAAYAIDSAWHTTDVSVTVNGGTITSQKIAIRQVPYSATAKSVLTVNGGSVYGGVAGVQVFHTAGSPTANLSETYLNGGSVSGGSYAFYTSFLWAGAHQNAKFVVTGGDYEGWVYLYNGKSGSSAYPVNFSITGGTFQDAVLIYTKDANGQTVNAEVVTGGTYGTDMNAYCAEGYNALEENGVWTVTAMDRSDVRTEKALRYLLTTDGSVKLGADIVLTDTLTVPAGVTATLDLNGHVLSQEKAQTAAYTMLVNQGNLTVTDTVGTGAIRYADTGNGGEYVSNTVRNDGTMFVNSGTIENVSSEAMANNGYAHGIDNNGALTVTGGTIRSNYYSSVRIWCTEDDNTSVTIEGGTFYGSVDLHNVSDKENKGTLTITGGTFIQNPWTSKVIRLVNFGTKVDGLSATVTGATIDGEIGISGSVTDVKYLNKVFNLSGVTVTADKKDTIVNTLDNGGDVVLADDVTFATTVSGYGIANINVKGSTFDGNGKTLSVTGSGDYTAIATTGGTIKNVTVDNGFRGLFLEYLTDDVVVDNVVLGGEGVCYALNTGSITDDTYTLTVTNSTLKGWTSFGLLKSASFTKCQFAQGEYYTNEYGRLLKPYIDTVFTDCSFIEGYILDVSSLTETVDFVNCTLGGEPLTAENLFEFLDLSDLRTGLAKVKVNGVLVFDEATYTP